MNYCCWKMFKWSLSKGWNTHNIWRALYDLCHIVNVCVCLCNIKSHLSYMVIISSAFQQYFFFLLSRFSHVQLFERQWTIAYQATLSMEFFQQEYPSGLPGPPPGGGGPCQAHISCIAGGFFTAEPMGKSTIVNWGKLFPEEDMG